ncbi:MAG: Riboflavin transporter [Pseudomonadota bacterium]|jgi:drug/metabolite transporter (DMT)-like permease
MRLSLIQRFLLANRQTRRKAAGLPMIWKGMLWMAAGGFLFSILNTIVRSIAMQMDPFEVQFLRYLFGLIVMLPWVFKAGPRNYWPTDVKGQFWRGGVHTVGMVLWFIALPKIPLADMTAISFTGPIFIMIGASWFLGEPMRRDRWIAALIGFTGVVVVVAPKMSGAGGGYHLVMLASAPLFAASFLITKALTRYEKATVIVFWQALTVSLFSLPLALLHWQNPSLWQWVGFFIAGILGSVGHYCWTRAFHAADISSTQSLRFLDLVWTSALGWLIFSDIPSQSTWIGAVVILAATVWLARREGQRPVKAPTDEPVH